MQIFNVGIILIPKRYVYVEPLWPELDFRQTHRICPFIIKNGAAILSFQVVKEPLNIACDVQTDMDVIRVSQDCPRVIALEMTR